MDYAPRAEFKPLHKRDTRWAIAVTHRRAGKTVACVNHLILAAHECPMPRPQFAYIAPQLNQAKDIAWNYLLDYTAGYGRRRRISATELWVEVPNRLRTRSRIRIYGADNPERLRGLYLDGVIFDEFADMDPQTWSKVIRPALTDRQGFAVFIGTPKGRNAFHRIWEEAGRDQDWYRLMLRASETRLLGPKELADARKFMSDDEYAQEYECSFDAAIRGAYWGRELQDAELKGRICNVPHDPMLQVHTAWDLGMADSTVIWFIQALGGPSGELRVIDVLKGEGQALAWYVQQIQQRGWVYGTHYVPHDIQVRELGTGTSRLEQLEKLGLRATVCRSLPLEDGIQAVRALLPRCWFDQQRCRAGIEALKMYRRKWDDRRQEYETHPWHDWTSHYADAFRYFAVEHQPNYYGAATNASPRHPIRRDLRWVV